MRAAKLLDPGKVALLDVEEPEPNADEVKVRVQLCGICGSDLHAYRGEREPGFHLGHEICGVVEKVGRKVSGLVVGDRVCAECCSYCGRCRYCARGDYNLCEDLAYMSGQEHGALADKVVLPAHTVYTVPESLSDADVMMVEPLAVAFRSVTRSRATDSLAVIGAGTIGLLCVAVAKARGVGRVLCVAKHPHQVAMAQQLGADRVIVLGRQDPVAAVREEIPDGVVSVIDCAGRGASFSQACAMLRKQGRAVLTGAVTDPLMVDLTPLLMGELELTGSCDYGVTEGRPDFAWAIEMIRDEQVHPDRLVTHTFALESVDEAFRVADDKSTGAIKVAVCMAD